MEATSGATPGAIPGFIFDTILDSKPDVIHGANSIAKSGAIINNPDCAKFGTRQGVQFVN
jgi:hypothetical protein